jgi:hypothetical protein
MELFHALTVYFKHFSADAHNQRYSRIYFSLFGQ